jgi:shikimate kinase
MASGQTPAVLSLAKACRGEDVMGISFPFHPSTFNLMLRFGAHEMNPADVNLYLVGFMGTGKTTVGRVVGQRLGFNVLDSDHEIERQQGKSIPEIFAQDGEPAFRAMERGFIESGHPAERTLVACGGGLVVQPGMLELLQRKGVILCLHASLDTILQRTARQRNRPLLDVEDPAERICTLYAAREPIYKRSGTLILTDSRPLSDIAAHVIRAWRRDAADFVRAGAARTHDTR